MLNHAIIISLIMYIQTQLILILIFYKFLFYINYIEKGKKYYDG